MNVYLFWNCRYFEIDVFAINLIYWNTYLQNQVSDGFINIWKL